MTDPRRPPAALKVRRTYVAGTVGVSRNARPAASRHAGDMGLRCVIVDDSAPFLKAARGLLEREGIEVVGVASTSTDAIRRVDELRPDLVLVDIDLGPDSGFDLVRHIDRNASDLGDGKPTIILISGHSEQDLKELIAASPAAGFLGKLSLSASAIRSLIWENGLSEPEANAPREM